MPKNLEYIIARLNKIPIRNKTNNLEDAEKADWRLNKVNYKGIRLRKIKYRNNTNSPEDAEQAGKRLNKSNYKIK